jgi:4'-phosphopantetheinyl transferase EntD
VIPDVALRLRLDHGLCVGVRLPRTPADVDALAEAVLVEEERAFADTLAPVRRKTWVGGRVALRLALAEALRGAPGPPLASPVLADGRGAPRVPAGIAASISHKESLAAALVTLDANVRVGVDVELDVARGRDIASRILTGEEEAELAPLPAAERAREVILRFSIKEAIYKALDPFVHRYVAFKEVSVTPRPDGGVDVRPYLRSAESSLAIEARWRRVEAERVVLTTARVHRSSSGGAIAESAVRSDP